MLRLPKDYFKDLNADKYRAYLKLLPDMRNEKTQAYTMLAFTLVALSFFGIFAINPTLSTIASLKKQLADSKYVDEQLQKKIQSLSILQQKYSLISADIPYLYSALPKDPASPILMAQVQALIIKNKLKVNSLQIFEVELSGHSRVPREGFSYTFSLTAEGDYENMIQFATDVSNFNRIVTIELFSITKDRKSQNLVLTMRGRQYFTPEDAKVPQGL